MIGYRQPYGGGKPAGMIGYHQPHGGGKPAGMIEYRQLYGGGKPAGMIGYHQLYDRGKRNELRVVGQDKKNKSAASQQSLSPDPF